MRYPGLTPEENKGIAEGEALSLIEPGAGAPQNPFLPPLEDEEDAYSDTREDGL